jgi:hypothetical protein
MPQFDAESIVDPLNVRLEPHVPGFGWRVIPEPSDLQVGQFLAGLSKAIAESRKKLKDAGDIDVNDREQLMAAMEDLEPDEFVKAADDFAALHAGLCAGPPGSEPVLTKAHLLAIPIRKRNHFYNWLQGEVLNPEAAGGGGSELVTTQPPAAAG